LLTELDWSALSSCKIIALSLEDNNFPEQDLSIFARFTRLENLYLSNYDEVRIKQGIYNKFFGSLAPLQDLTLLKELDISNTDISSGYEYLPISIREVCGSSQERPTSRVQEITPQL
jgi:Leucine-rich repeat (LRR) protein